MNQTCVAIYCRAINCKDISTQRMTLDRLYFRIAAYAHSHKLSIVSYYEDVESTDDHPGLSNLLIDFGNSIFDTVLVSNNSQIPDDPAYIYPFTLLSIDSSERRIYYS